MEEGSGWGTHVYLWQIHFDILQNQYNIVKLNKIKLKKIKMTRVCILLMPPVQYRLVRDFRETQGPGLTKAPTCNPGQAREAECGKLHACFCPEGSCC